MSKKTLIIKRDNKDIFFGQLDGIEQYYRCSHRNIFFRICLRFKLPIISIFFGKWKKNINKYDIIILFDNGCNENILKYIKRKNKHTKIIFWYWNSLIEYGNKVIEDKNIDEIWTYNRFDAQKYNLKYNSQFYSKNMKLNNSEVANDVIFVGRDKGREEQIKEIKQILEANGLSCDFNVIKNEKDYMSYEEYLEKLSKCKCILDFSYTDYNGLSLRPLESLFFEKKLITNNKDIVNYNFYNPHNIFVLGINNMNGINEFVNSPYEEIDENIINYYDFKQWLKRFEENQDEF